MIGHYTSTFTSNSDACYLCIDSFVQMVYNWLNLVLILVDNAFHGIDTDLLVPWTTMVGLCGPRSVWVDMNNLDPLQMGLS